MSGGTQQSPPYQWLTAKCCSHSWGNLSGLALNLALGYSSMRLLLTVRLVGVQQHSGHRTKLRKSHHSLPTPCLFRPPNPIFQLLFGWLKQYTTDHCEYSVACVNAFDMSPCPSSCSLASQPFILSSYPCCHPSRSHDSSSYGSWRCFRKTVRKRHGQGWGWRDKSFDLRGTWVILITEILFFWVY